MCGCRESVDFPAVSFFNVLYYSYKFTIENKSSTLPDIILTLSEITGQLGPYPSTIFLKIRSFSVQYSPVLQFIHITKSFSTTYFYFQNEFLQIQTSHLSLLYVLPTAQFRPKLRNLIIEHVLNSYEFDESIR